MGFPGGSAGKESSSNVGDLGSIHGMGRSPGEGKGYPLQCSGMENSMNCIVHGVAKSQIWLSDFHFHFTEENSERDEHTWPASWETYMQVRKQQLELDMEQQTGSK